MKEGTVLDFFKKGISREEKEAQDARLAAQADQSAAEFKEKAAAAAKESGGLASYLEGILVSDLSGPIKF
jgi:hypothetical protein